MRSRSILAAGFAGTLLFTACSSSTIKEKEATSTNANGTVGTVASANVSNANTTVVNGMIVPAQPVNANVAAADPMQPSSLMQERLNRVKQTGASGPAVDPREMALKNARPAPENSTFTSYLSDAGYEIRTFKDHPQLLRAEKRVAGSDDQTLKVFLRNGKVVEVPGQKVESLSTISAAGILSAAGIALEPAPGAVRSAKKVPGN
jgi:hypothetical protein